MSNVDQTFGFISKLPELEEPLSAGNYSQKFKTLLYAEEHQMMVDIRRYDRKGKTMTPSKKFEGLLNLSVSDKKRFLLQGKPFVLIHYFFFKTLVYKLQSSVVGFQRNSDNWILRPTYLCNMHVI